MRNLDISLLRVFVAVSELRSMTAAANLQGMTQGAVSQKMARLEALAGAKLLTREKRGLVLTPAGERLLGNARRMVGLNDEMWSEMTGGVVEGALRFGLPNDLVALFVPLLKGLVESYPKVDLQLHCGSSGDLSRHMVEGRLDLAVLEEPLGNAGGECLWIDRLVWVGKAGGTASMRDPLPISLVSETCSFRPAILAALKASDREARTVFEGGGLDAALATIRMDIAVSAWLASTVPADLRVLAEGAGLPALPSYAITLHRGGRASSGPAQELARQIRDGLNRPQPAYLA
ncbi:LysR family transcriptional regulator [Bosea sp. PAMC 26642]|uniref:LysR family transcriptional regulator n=1 Tax=Bosea sp. (strain PAMC 26642) TaxID=1792307 RepID=UPI000770295A|nr:LysR family transcriptional regulator [Bosea sp. PAMC 26642]AMJ61129.1 LysR family transcriptional regulator [Bosea sp. PAMC 26642]